MDLENKEQQESGLSLADILTIIKANWIMIAILTLLMGLMTYFYVSNFVEDRYKSTSEILVQVPVPSGQVDSTSLSNSQRLLDTASEFVRSPYIVTQLRETEYYNLFTNPTHKVLLDGLSNQAIVSNINVTSSSTSFIIRLSYGH